MKTNNFKYKLYIFVCFSIAILSAAMRAVLLLFNFDREIGYYSHGSILPTFHTVLLCIAVVFAASYLLATRKDEHIQKKFHVFGFFVFSCALCGFSLLGQFVSSLFIFDLSTLEKIAAYTAIPAALYFFMMFIKCEESKNLRTLFGFFVPVWGTLNLACVYFDSYIAINAPNKIIEQMAFLSVMLYFLYELRVHIDKQKPRLQVFFGLSALIFCATAAFPSIIAVSLDVIDSKYLMYDVIFAAMFIYVCASLLGSITEKEE